MQMKQNTAKTMVARFLRAQGYGEIISKLIFYNCILLICALLTLYIFNPVMDRFIKSDIANVSIIFLPFAIKILVAFFEGFRAPFYLLPGAFLFEGLYNTTAFSLPVQIGVLYLSYAVPAFVFWLLDWAMQTDRRLDFSHPRSWRLLYIVSFISSLICACILFAANPAFHQLPTANAMRSILIFVTGDLMGMTIILMFIAISVRQFKPRRATQQ